jgi:ABC-type lipoprotein release transport system permease subunit
MFIQLAWRNIWRNRRRTLITIASVLFAVFFSTLMESLQKGAWGYMIGNVVNFFTGYVQVHRSGYQEEQSLDLAFFPGEASAAGEVREGVKDVLPRLESFALASTGSNTMGVMVTGIKPAAEHGMTKIRDRLEAGRFIGDSDRQVLIAAGIAERLQLRPGDTLLLISQGYHGVNAAAKYPVKGIVRYPSPDLNRLLVFLPLQEAQWFYGAEGRVTSLVYRLESEASLPAVVGQLRGVLPREEFEVLDWREMLPDLLEAQKLDSAGNIVVYVILYMIIGFGLLGTILMMARERRYEFGLLIALGMKRWKLGVVVWLEVVFLGMLGAVAGILSAIPAVIYLQRHPLRFSGGYSELLEQFGFEPIFPALFSFGIFFVQAMIVLGITAILAIFPFWKISRLHPVKAMHSR